MLLGEVIGTVVSTNKEEKILGYKLLIVKPFADFNFGKNIVAIDRVGAGIDNQVIVTTGSSARVGLDRQNVPIDAAIVGIID